ncbi:MAG: ELM1/GtrOC1 family putative glycosyltransferase, partial [Pseudomonadota bacterium]
MLDGRAGHAAQALGLAEALARRHPETVIETRCVRPKAWAAVLPPAVWQWLGRTLPRWPALALEAPETLLAPLPGPRARRLVIAAGRRTAPVAAWLARTGGARSVQLMHPQMDLRAFDLVVAPSHDGLQAPNAVATTGALGRLTRPAIAAAAKAEAARFTDLPTPRLAVLVGGPSDSARFGEDDATRLIEACLSAAA